MGEGGVEASRAVGGARGDAGSGAECDAECDAVAGGGASGESLLWFFADMLALLRVTICVGRVGCLALAFPVAIRIFRLTPPRCLVFSDCALTRIRSHLNSRS